MHPLTSACHRLRPTTIHRLAREVVVVFWGPVLAVVPTPTGHLIHTWTFQVLCRCGVQGLGYFQCLCSKVVGFHCSRVASSLAQGIGHRGLQQSRSAVYTFLRLRVTADTLWMDLLNPDILS